MKRLIIATAEKSHIINSLGALSRSKGAMERDEFMLASNVRSKSL
jgi:hypothetical protein